MTFEQLRVLRAIVSEGSFHAAAKQLNKSQPSISHTIKKLEQEIGIKLLSREEYRPNLTASGRIFYRESSEILDRMHQLSSLIKNLSTDQEAEILLAVTATCALGPLLRIIGKTGSDFPATHIRISTESLGGTIERLMKDDADIIIATMDEIPAEEVVAIPFTSVNIIPVSHPDYGPAKSGRMNSENEMQGYTQIVVADSGSSMFQQSRDLLPGSLRWTVSDFAAKKEIILAKMGWGGLPEHLIRDELEKKQLVKLEVEGYPVRRSQLFQIRKRHRTVGKVAQTLWTALMGCYT